MYDQVCFSCLVDINMFPYLWRHMLIHSRVGLQKLETREKSKIDLNSPPL